MKSLDASAYDTDKTALTHYLRNYEQCFKNLWDKEIRLLELGVKNGGSLLLWRDYFVKGLIVGLDINPVQIHDPTRRIRIYRGAQQDTRLLDRIALETAPDGFDIIIDDCSHVGVLTRMSFWHLFDNHLKSGGLYVIEDWGTGYWNTWIDGAEYRPRPPAAYSPFLHRLTKNIARLQNHRRFGRMPLVKQLLAGAKRAVLKPQYYSHDFGLVGFVKELVDECGRGDITHPDMGRAPYQPSKFKEMRLSHGHLFIVKA